MKNGLIFTIWLAIVTFFKLTYKIIKASIKTLSAIVVFFGLYIPLFYVVFGLVLLATTKFSFGFSSPAQIAYMVGLFVCCIIAIIVAIRNCIYKPISSVFAAFKKKDEGNERQRRYDEDDRPRRRRDDDYDDYEEYRDRNRQRSRRYYVDEDDYQDYPPQRPVRNRDDNRRLRYNSDYDDDYYELPRPTYSRPYQEPRIESAHPSRMLPPSPDMEDMPQPFEEKPLIYRSKMRPGIIVHEFDDRFELFEESRDGQMYVGTEYKK